MGTITSRGYSEKKVYADRQRYTLTFIGEAADTRSTIISAQAECECFLEEIVKLGFDIKDIHLQNDEISECYADNKTLLNQRKTIDFEVAFSLSLHERILKIIAENKLRVLLNIEQSFSKKEKLHEELLKEAVNDSRKNAEMIAQMAGQKLLGIEAIDERHNYLNNVCVEDAKALKFTSSGLLSEKLSSKELLESEEIYITWKISE